MSLDPTYDIHELVDTSASNKERMLKAYVMTLDGKSRASSHVPQRSSFTLREMTSAHASPKQLPKAA